jgi:hypothetical protein
VERFTDVEMKLNNHKVMGYAYEPNNKKLFIFGNPHYNDFTQAVRSQ